MTGSGAGRTLFISHAQVVIDPAVPVPDWPLSEAGRARHLAFNGTDAAGRIRAIYCSAERKARDGADILAERVGVTPVVMEALGENDRSATGFLAKEEFERTADAFFASPHESIRGWERAVDAQTRIVGAVDTLLAGETCEGDVAIVSHGGVGALLLAHICRAAISRVMDQPGGGGGNLFAFTRDTRTLIHPWRPLEEADAAVDDTD